MKLANPFKFFQQALGLKEVTEDHQAYLIACDDEEIPAVRVIQRQLSPSRRAAFSAFSNKLSHQMAPIFSQTDINVQLQDAHEMNCAMTLLESLELTCLAQAIVDDDRDTVKAMLDKKPELLLLQPEVIVTSEYTGQRFGVDGNFLGLACLRKQIKMVKIILPYFEKLQTDEEQNEEIAAIKNAGMAQWLNYPTNANGEIQVPADYQAIIDDLIKVFKSEPIAVGTTDFRTLSANIETAMETLYNRLIPDFKEEDISKRHVFTKQNYLDVELLLYAAYKAYETHFSSFKTWEKRSAYSIRVIGILQNFLSPETAKIFCEGLYDVVEENKAISERAAGLKLKDGTSFYSGSDFALRAGLGFEFLTSTTPWPASGVGVNPRWVLGLGVYMPWLDESRTPMLSGNLCQTKTKIFRELYNTTNSANPSTGPRT